MSDYLPLRNRIEQMLGRMPVPPVCLTSRKADSHKGDFGRVLLVGGSRGMAGSISLSASSCLKSGAGLVTAAVPDCCLETVASFNPCIMTIPLANNDVGQFDDSAVDRFEEIQSRFDVIVMGPGMGTGSGAKALVQSAIRLEKSLVLDADALNVLSEWKGWQRELRSTLVMTPHPGEFQRLSGVSARDRDAQIASATEFADEANCVVLLKGASTLVTDGQRNYRNDTGNPGMATGGSGDCLTGLIGALLGQGLNGFDAAVTGAWTHGLAGDLAAARCGQPGLTALEIVDFLPWAVSLLTDG